LADQAGINPTGPTDPVRERRRLSGAEDFRQTGDGPWGRASGVAARRVARSRVSQAKAVLQPM